MFFGKKFEILFSEKFSFFFSEKSFDFFSTTIFFIRMFFNDLDCASRAPENNRGCSTTSSEREIDRAYGGKNTARFASEPPESPTWSGETVRNTVMFRYPTGFPNFGTVLHFYVGPRASPPLRDILHRYRRSENRRRISVGLFGNARGDKPIHCRCSYPGIDLRRPGAHFFRIFTDTRLTRAADCCCYNNIIDAAR